MTHQYFDAYAGYGPFNNKDPQARWTLEHLLEDLDLASIDGALVHHNMAQTYDPMFINRRMIHELAPHRDRLAPCFAALPDVAGDFPSPKDFLKELKDNNVRAVRIDPDRYNFPAIESIWAPLRDALQYQQILCIFPVTYGGGQDFLKLDAILSIFNRGPCLIVNHGWTHFHAVASLMTRHPQLHLEFSHFQANRAPEVFAGRFGAQRCLFGSGLPHRAPGAARGFFDYSLLPAADVEKITHGNLTRLLGFSPKPSTTPQPFEDDITRAVKLGQPIPCPVYDAHCHIGHDGGASLTHNVVAHKGDAAGMLELKDKVGIDKTAIMSWSGPLSMDTDLGNHTVAHAVARHPDRFIGLSTINPDYDSPEKIQQIIHHYHVKLRFPGLKTFTPCQTIDYNDPAFHAWLSFGDTHRLYMVFDPKNGTGSTDVAHDLATRYPNLSIHLDHCGQSWPYARWAAGLVKKYPNIHAQLNFTMVTNGVIEYLAREVGAERMLFGTDSPMRDPRPQATWLAFTRISQQQKQLIYAENFQRDLVRAYPSSLA
jgi:predicted TIM-barrel fold metal-dependent hydrolase